MNGGTSYQLVPAHQGQATSLSHHSSRSAIDDLPPPPNWPENHAPRVAELLATLERRSDLTLTKLNWSTGIIIAAKTL
jgi:hypothetical protein